METLNQERTRLNQAYDDDSEILIDFIEHSNNIIYINNNRNERTNNSTCVVVSTVRKGCSVEIKRKIVTIPSGLILGLMSCLLLT